MKKLISIIFIFLFLSCSENDSDCKERSSAYWTATMFGEPHNTRIKGENLKIREAFQKIKKSETNIEPKDGFITLRLHIDKYGKFCNQENFQIDTEYQPAQFNNGNLIRKLELISSNLKDWENDTETKTYYLIRIKIKGGLIDEIF